MTLFFNDNTSCSHIKSDVIIKEFNKWYSWKEKLDLKLNVSRKKKKFTYMFEVYVFLYFGNLSMAPS